MKVEKNKVTLDLSEKNIKSVILQLMFEQNAVLKVVLDLVSFLITTSNGEYSIEKFKEQIQLNNYNIEKNTYDLIARVIRDFENK